MAKSKAEGWNYSVDTTILNLASTQSYLNEAEAKHGRANSVTGCTVEDVDDNEPNITCKAGVVPFTLNPPNL